ncbi:MAG: zinc ribbon domain-containing protein [Thermoplasmata archaeon]
MDGPTSINDFLGGAGTENPGFGGYPATKSQLLSAAQMEFTDIEGSDPADLRWFEQHLPEGTYRDAGEVIAALAQTITGPKMEGPAWIRRSQVGAIAVGTRLSVPPGVIAVLSRPNLGVLDVFQPGDYILSSTTAPLASAHSRAPAPGSTRSTIRASIAFYSTQTQAGRLAVSLHTTSRERFQVIASVSFSVQDPRKLATSPAGSSLSSPPAPDALLSRLATPSLEQLLQSREEGTAAPDPSMVESTIREALERAGLSVSVLNLERADRPTERAIPPGIPPEMLANLPPEARAALQARMEEAMRRRAAAGAGPVGASPGPRPPQPPAPSAASVNCPACQAPNPNQGKFCNACGSPLKVRRVCPSCGKEVPPGVKFCGSCGARMDPN